MFHMHFVHIHSQNAGAKPPIAKLVKKVNTQTEANATCFFHRGQRRGSLGSVGDGRGNNTMVDAPSSKLPKLSARRLFHCFEG
jgi:hypothetical protein